MNGKNQCTKCHRRIANAVCRECRLKQIKAWLDECSIEPKIKESLIKEADALFPDKLSNVTRCVYCNKKEVSLCTYCFFSSFEDVLRKFDMPKDVIGSFRRVFHYRLYERKMVAPDHS
jgi:hypothetical protein